MVLKRCFCCLTQTHHTYYLKVVSIAGTFPVTSAEELSSSTSFSTRGTKSKRGFYPTQGEISQHESLEVTPLITCRGNVTLFAPSHQTCYKPARDSPEIRLHELKVWAAEDLQWGRFDVLYC